MTRRPSGAVAAAHDADRVVLALAQRGREDHVGLAFGIGAERAGRRRPLSASHNTSYTASLSRGSPHPQVHRRAARRRPRGSRARSRPGAAPTAAEGHVVAAARLSSPPPNTTPRRGGRGGGDRRAPTASQRGRGAREQPAPARAARVGRVLARVGVQQPLLERGRERLGGRRLGAAGQRRAGRQRRERVVLGGALGAARMCAPDRRRLVDVERAEDIGAQLRRSARSAVMAPRPSPRARAAASAARTRCGS